MGVAALALGLALAGCDATAGAGSSGSTPPAPAPQFGGVQFGHVHDAEVLVAGRDLEALFTEDDGWRVSPPLEAPDGATRAGWLLDLWEDRGLTPGDEVTLEARGRRADGTWTDWSPAEVTWQEHPHLVARAELGESVTAAQMRVSAARLGAIAHVTWSALTPVDEQALDDGAGGSVDTQPAGLSSGLAAAGFEPRSAWNAQPTKCTSYDPNKLKMAVHHTFTPTTSYGSYAKRIRSIQSYHMDTKGWCDVGYHFLVTADGTVWEGRPLQHRGAHVGNHNSGNIGISLVGCFEPGACDGIDGAQVPSEPMVTALADALAVLSDDHGIALTSAKVKGHQEHAGASTSCPGDNVMDLMPQLLDGSLQSGGSAGGGGGDLPAPAPSPVTGRILGVVYDGSVTGWPSQAGNVRLPSATVAVDGVQLPVSAGSAFWQVALPPGEHTVSASAPGYVSLDKTVAVEAGEDHWASAGLVPEGAKAVLKVLAFEADTVVLTTLPGAAVHLTDYVTGESLGLSWTGPNGDLQIQMETDEAFDVQVTVAAPGFAPRTLGAKLSPGAVTSLYAAMQPPIPAAGTTGSLQGVIWDAAVTPGPNDAGNVRLDGAVVACACGQADAARAGDAYWRFDAAPGPWRVWAFAPGYAPGSSDLVADPGSPAWGSMGLAPTN